MTEINDSFRTNDLGLAAYLVMLGHPLQGTWWKDPPPRGSCYWLFVEIPTLTQAVDDWIRKTVLVEPRKYNGVYKDLKRELVSVMKSSSSTGVYGGGKPS